MPSAEAPGENVPPTATNFAPNFAHHVDSHPRRPLCMQHKNCSTCLLAFYINAINCVLLSVDFIRQEVAAVRKVSQKELPRPLIPGGRAR